MPLPSNEGFGTVIGKILDNSGAAVTGTVSFTASPKKLLNSTSVPPVTIVTKAITATIAVDGTFTQDLVATDDVDNSPSGWTYNVTFSLDGGLKIDPFNISVPEGSTVDLTLVAPVDTSEGTTSTRGSVYLLETTETVADIPATFPVGGLIFQKQ